MSEIDLFRNDGHLTDAALATLVKNDELDQLTRLEIAEHLSFCDICLHRYTTALENTEFLSPAHTCRESLWLRIRRRSIRMFSKRYATAAAAVALALAVLWGSNFPAVPSAPEPPPAMTEEQPVTLPEQFDTALGTVSETMRDFFNHIGDLRRNTERSSHETT